MSLTFYKNPRSILHFFKESDTQLFGSDFLAETNGIKHEEESDEHPLRLIPALLKDFYWMGWCSGTGGGISIRSGNKIYIAPSGVQKERVKVLHIKYYIFLKQNSVL